ncbi:MAG: uncharacterized protein DUF4255 [Candidatus Accumulibacter regalis]|jgi:hypothetical protein
MSPAALASYSRNICRYMRLTRPPELARALLQGIGKGLEKNRAKRCRACDKAARVAGDYAQEDDGKRMANVFAVHSVGSSIATFLRNTYPAEIGGRALPACDFELVSAGQLAGDGEERNRITLFLYRLSVNEHSRQSAHLRASDSRLVPLGLDLHYLMSSWGMTPQDEQVALTWALRQLHEFPVLDASSLTPDAGWASDEVIQIVPSELATEDLMRIWDAVTPSYRLSVSYVARLVRIDPESDDAQFRPVLSGRFAFGEEAS